MKGLAESSPFRLLTNPHVINRFIFGHGLFIFYIYMFVIAVSVTDTKATYRLSSFELSVNVEVLMGDITKEATDVIVNSVHWNLDLSASMYTISAVK